MVPQIFLCACFLSILFAPLSPLFAKEQPALLLRYKPRIQEAMYTYYSRSQTLFTNGSFQKMVSSNGQAYVGMRSLKTLENGHIIQRARVHAGNVEINQKIYAHPAVGHYMDYVLGPQGAIPKAIGNGTQFQVKDLQMVFPDQPVSVGSSWSVTIPPSISFPIETKVEYSVSSILGSLVIMNAKVSTAKDELIRGLNFTLKGTSQIIFNADEGLLVRNESNQYLEISKPGKKSERSTKINVNSILELQF